MVDFEKGKIVHSKFIARIVYGRQGVVKLSFERFESFFILAVPVEDSVQHGFFLFRIRGWLMSNLVVLKNRSF